MDQAIQVSKAAIKSCRAIQRVKQIEATHHIEQRPGDFYRVTIMTEAGDIVEVSGDLGH